MTQSTACKTTFSPTKQPANRAASREAALYSPERLTVLLRGAVPAFDRAGVRFVSLERGAAEALLPLEVATTNQHGTHQATLMALAGDYTGGAALGTVLDDVPLVGVHPVYGFDSACLWLAKFEITYHAPSSTDLGVCALVPPAQHEMIRSRFWKGDAQMLPLRVTFWNDGESRLVAEGVFVYYLRHSAHVRPKQPNKRPGVMCQHLARSSARLIANVRGRESERRAARYDDPYSRRAAGKHGQLLADRFLSLLPELREMVAARTCDADECLRQAIASGVGQVILVGAGLDFRPFRIPAASGTVRFFELDLPEMIVERKQCVSTMDLPPVERVTVPFNLLSDAPADVLSRVDSFSLDRPVFVIYEGCSMYFDEETGAGIFGRLSDLVRRHPASRMWVDLVSEAVGSGRTDSVAIQAFLDGMASMGEPFLFGHDSPQQLFARHGLRVVRETMSDAFQDGLESEVYRSYRFVLLAAGSPALAVAGA